MVRAGRHDIDVYLDLAAAMASDETPVDHRDDRDTGWRRSATTSPTPREQAALSGAGFAQRFGPALTALGLPGTAGDSDERQSRRAHAARIWSA